MENQANAQRKAKVTDEHRAEAARLKALWEARKPHLAAVGLGSQLSFGAKYEIGTQAAVGFFLNGHTPLSLKAAKGFAEGLGCRIADFSPRLAAEIRELSDAISAEALGGFDPAPPDLTLREPALGKITHFEFKHSPRLNERPAYAEALADTLGDALLGLPAVMRPRSVDACRKLAESPDSGLARGELWDVLQHSSALKPVPSSAQGTRTDTGNSWRTAALRLAQSWHQSDSSPAQASEERRLLVAFIAAVDQAIDMHQVENPQIAQGNGVKTD